MDNKLKTSQLQSKIDIGVDEGYLSETLSNFTEHKFVFDGVECNSMEGFLQSLKFAEPEKQIEICKLTGKKAKFKGKKKKWYLTQTLYWKGMPIARDSDEYQQLLDQAFKALSLNKDFQNALLATKNCQLIHSLGKKDINTTVLTEQEFVSRLESLRGMLNRSFK